MNVILQEKVANLGKVGDIVNVKPGYARNYLLPRGIAIAATADNMEEFEKKRVELEKAAESAKQAALARAERLEHIAVTIRAQAGEEGRLFGSIGPKDIAESITKEGVEVAKSEVTMPTGPIRMIGDYDIVLNLHSEVSVKVKIVIVASKKE